MELKINEKFKSLAPPLTPEEYKQLEENIIAEGCRDALVTWNGYIVDGHNRYAICTKHGIEFRTIEREFDGEESAADWIDANQLGRRNLTPDQMRLIRGRRYSRAEKRPGARSDLTSGQSDTRLPVADRLADQYGVSAPTIKRDGDLYERVEILRDKYPEEVEKIYSGEVRANPVLKEIYQSEKRAGVATRKWTESEEQRREKVKAGETVTCNIYVDMKLVEWAKDNELYERIDRCTDWGNPFEIPGDGDRQEVCESYKIYYGLKKSLHPRIGDLKGKVLGCHCYPEQCHGDFLKEVAENADR